MKKVIGIITGLLTLLALPLPAFAVTDVSQTCPPILNSLCSANMAKIIGNIITALIVIAILIAIFVIIWGGIKWILSGGDKAKIESARSTIIGGIIGLVIVFLAWFVIMIVAQIFGINITSGFIIPNIITN